MLGELWVFVALATWRFVGGSLVEIGGHNPLEPARLGAAILLGPYVFNFAEVCQTLRAAGGCYHVQDTQSLAKEVWALLDDPPLRRQMIDAAARVAVSETQVLDQVLAALEPLITSAEPARPADLSGHASP